MLEERKIQIPDKAVVVGVGLKSDSFVELKESLSELEELCFAAGSEVVGNVVQTLSQFNSATLVGVGKVQEIKQLVENAGANVVVIDHHLSGVQSRNLEKEIGARVIDRSQLILDIFAQRANSYEGKLQVELAQMMDQLPRMVGAWMGSHSRLGGGIGTRGPGESALETDRRRIRDRIKQIKKKLEIVRRQRMQYRAKRRKQKTPSFAMIGYTNSGKSSLLNILTGSKELVKNQVFATLDPKTRKVFLPATGQAVVTDTVGFIRKLPTELIEAFKATLEESGEADILIHVIDLSSPHMDRQIQVVKTLIDEFKWNEKPIIHVYNKLDIAPSEKQFHVKDFPRVMVSAKTGQGIERLKKLMEEAVHQLNQEVELFFPREQEHRIYELGRQAQIVRTESNSQGTICVVHLTQTQMSEWSQFLISEVEKLILET